MLTIREIEDYFSHIDPQLLEIILELRNVIFTIVPDATEMIQWQGISYFDASHGGTVSGGICQIHVVDGNVRVGFIHGAFLHDPKHLLVGTRKAKRYLEIDAYNTAPWEDIKTLIQTAAEFDPYSLKL